MLQYNKNYWLVVEPYTYMSFAGDTVFVYNTLDGSCIESDDQFVIDLLRKIRESAEGLIRINGSIFRNKAMEAFILAFRDHFMGDVIDCELTKGQPFQPAPILNLQNSVEQLKKEQDRGVGENILTHLHELLFFLGNPDAFPTKYYPSTLTLLVPEYLDSNDYLSFQQIKDCLMQLPFNKKDLALNFVLKNNCSCKDIGDLMILLSDFIAKKKFIFHYDNEYITTESIRQIEDSSIEMDIYFDFPVKTTQMEHIINLLNLKKRQSNFHFAIKSENEINVVEKYVSDFQLQQCTFFPVYTGRNYEFFEKNIFLTKEDILSSPVSMRDIFIHQSLNIESFGKLIILPTGEAYSNLFTKKLGSIKKPSLLELLHKEAVFNHSWFKIRDYIPCNNCRYQWLCPSPSVYEIMLNKKNFCFINK
jgi:pseudo-rSAM protein